MNLTCSYMDILKYGLDILSLNSNIELVTSNNKYLNVVLSKGRRDY